MQEKAASQPQSNSAGRTIGLLVVVMLWGALAAIATAAALEGYLAYKWTYLKPRQRAFLKQKAESSQPVFKRISEAYFPFAVQHINPYYLFFYPFDKNARTNISNEVCSIDEKGFRGQGPEAAGERKLAFMLGGSALFGHYASSDSTTITGYLNALQSEYFFVNAGVPSWNSLQELYRLAFQILDYDPEIVIAYDGGNDIALTCLYWKLGLDYPAGTPESFNKLHALVEDIRGKAVQTTTSSRTFSLFPRLSKSIRARLERKAPKTKPTDSAFAVGNPGPLIRATTDRYLSNLTHMQAMTQAAGARFIAIFQPIGPLHENAPDDQKRRSTIPSMRIFRDQVFSTPNSLVEHVDYSTFFEKLDGPLPWLDHPGYPDLSDDTIFIDGFHVYDLGNRMIAEEILRYLNATPQRPHRTDA